MGYSKAHVKGQRLYHMNDFQFSAQVGGNLTCFFNQHAGVYGKIDGYQDFFLNSDTDLLTVYLLWRG